MIIASISQPEKTDILSLEPQELQAIFFELKQPGYRVNQIFSALHGRQKHFTEIQQLPTALRQQLSEKYEQDRIEMKEKQVSSDGTEKYLFKLADRQCVESVFMRYEHGNTVCISTQAGCRMGCAFCASGIGGLVRNLNPSEMLSQVYQCGNITNQRISNIVLMGTGEPLDNMDSVLSFIRLVNHSDGLNIGQRHISLSTCGLADQIDRLAEHNLAVTLSISLHAASDEKRRQIMPINRAWPLEQLLAACRRYQTRTGRRISYEYALFDRFNDTPDDADALCAMLKGSGGHINLIRANPVAQTGFRPSTKMNVARFQQILTDGGLTATIRRSLGADIDGACGQLRRKS